jgi:hypothetical protein
MNAFKTGDVIRIRGGCDFLLGLHARVIAARHSYITIELLDASPKVPAWKRGSKLTVAPYEAELMEEVI